MTVFDDLADDITKALGMNNILARSWNRSDSNVVYALSHEKGNFFAKVFALDGGDASLPARTRYQREKKILANRWPVGVPELVFAADTQRLLIMRAVEGHGFKHFADQNRSLEALGRMAAWLAGFHAAGPVEPRDGDLWTEFTGYANFAGLSAMNWHRDALSAYPVKEYVFSKGDVRMAKWKFAPDGTYGLDFEDVAMRPKEFDMVGLIRAARQFCDHSTAEMGRTIAQHYHSVRPIEQIEETVDAITRLAEQPAAAKNVAQAAEL